MKKFIAVAERSMYDGQITRSANTAAAAKRRVLNDGGERISIVGLYRLVELGARPQPVQVKWKTVSSCKKGK